MSSFCSVPDFAVDGFDFVTCFVFVAVALAAGLVSFLAGDFFGDFTGVLTAAFLGVAFLLFFFLVSSS